MRFTTLCGFGILCGLIACGRRELEVAKAVNFRVNFDSKIVEMSFDLAPDYQIRANNRINFENLAQQSLEWMPDEFGRLGIRLRASPEFLERSWPTHVAQHLPNEFEFPEPWSSLSFNEWTIDTNDLSFQLYYRDSDNLLFGGGVTGDDFSFLPKNLRGVQFFKDRIGNIKASLLVFGPTSKQPGGIFYFGDLGLNPFKESSSPGVPGPYKYDARSNSAIASFAAAGPMTFSEALPRDLALYYRAQSALDSVGRSIQGVVTKLP